jgi:nitroreductase
MHPTISSTAWEIDPSRLPPLAGVEAKLRFALQYAVLAPSSHNSQPWHFIVDGDSVMLCADRTRALPVVDPFDRELIISCGAVLFNLRVALQRFGLGYSIRLFPVEVDPDVLAHVRVLPNGSYGRNWCSGEAGI